MPTGTDTGWLGPVTQAQIDAINTALPSHTQVWPLTDSLGSMFLGSDLLTDCMNPGDNYYQAKDLLLALEYGTPVMA